MVKLQALHGEIIKCQPEPADQIRATAGSKPEKARPVTGVGGADNKRRKSNGSRWATAAIPNLNWLKNEGIHPE